MLQVLPRLQFSLKNWQTLCYVFTLMSYLKVKPNFFSIFFICVCALSFSLCIYLVCYLYVTRIYSYVSSLSLVCTGMSTVCHLYVIEWHPYVTRLWFYHEPHTVSSLINIKNI